MGPRLWKHDQPLPPKYWNKNSYLLKEKEWTRGKWFIWFTHFTRVRDGFKNHTALAMAIVLCLFIYSLINVRWGKNLKETGESPLPNWRNIPRTRFWNGYLSSGYNWVENEDKWRFNQASYFECDTRIDKNYFVVKGAVWNILFLITFLRNVRSPTKFSDYFYFTIVQHFMNPPSA